MGLRFTFKQYLNSKKQLREAVKKTPKRSAEYTIRKYCKLVVGESSDTKDYITLKPGHIILIDWLYTNIDNPTPINIQFSGLNKINESHKFKTYWEGAKLSKWLERNSFEKGLF